MATQIYLLLPQTEYFRPGRLLIDGVLDDVGLSSLRGQQKSYPLGPQDHTVPLLQESTVWIKSFLLVSYKEGTNKKESSFISCSG